MKGEEQGPAPRRVLVADDHEVTRRGVRELLQDAFPGVEVGEAADGEGALAALDRPWDLILLDVIMPGRSILELLAAIRGREPDVPVLVLTGATELEYVIQTLKAGANGFIHKQEAVDELLRAIRAVLAGETYLDREGAAALASSLREGGGSAPHERLSPRELEVFLAIARGRAVKEAAADLGLSDKTVATYLARIREKTGLTSHVEIARYALLNRLVD